MTPLQNLIDHLNDSLPEGDDVSDDYLSGYKACIDSIRHYLNNQRVNGKLRADSLAAKNKEAYKG